MKIILIEGGLSTFEIILSIGIFVLALCSLLFSFYIFRYQYYKDSKDLKLDWYKTIILESKFGNFFEFFDTVKILLDSLRTETQLQVGDKQNTNNLILEEFINLRHEFISLLLSVDKMLHMCVMKQFDDFYDEITEKLFDETIDLSDNDVFNDEITSHISIYRTNILKLFVEFRGENDSHLMKSIKVKFDEVFGNDTS
jgi:hypothetical protein